MNNRNHASHSATDADFVPGQPVESLNGLYSGIIRRRIYSEDLTSQQITEVEVQRFGGLGAVRLPGSKSDPDARLEYLIAKDCDMQIFPSLKDFLATQPMQKVPA